MQEAEGRWWAILIVLLDWELANGYWSGLIRNSLIQSWVFLQRGPLRAHYVLIEQ
jgi:hypothetical protein